MAFFDNYSEHCKDFINSLPDDVKNKLLSLPDRYKDYFVRHFRFYTRPEDIRYLITYPEKCRDILGLEFPVYNENNFPPLENRTRMWALSWIIENVNHDQFIKVEYHENFKDFQNLEWKHLKGFPEFSQRKANKDPSILNTLSPVENRSREEVCDWIRQHMNLDDLLYVGL